MNTREADIAKIEEDMSKGIISERKGRELIDRLYRQTKDHGTEDMRKKLIEEQRIKDRNYRMVRENPEKLDKHQLQQAIRFFNLNPHEF